VLLALASEHRLGILLSLAEGSKDVGTLAAGLRKERSHVSMHLQCLR
jgi:DNA-binding transcriptional ArsR family regulator